MMQTNNITQTVLEQALDHAPDLLGNKIKLRDESYQNFGRHVGNVAFKGSSISKSEPINANFTVLPNVSGNVSYSGSKPINVKESMFMGISSHAKVEHPFIAPTSSSAVVSETNDSTVVPVIDQTPIQNDININDRFTEISNARQLVQDAMTRADQAQQEAFQSEETLNKLSIEEAEVQKKLEEAETRKQMIEDKIRKALSDQAETLDATRKKYEDLIVEANNKRDQSAVKIEDFRTRINSTNDKLSQIENEIADSQQILDALNQFEFSNNNFSYPTTPSVDDYENGMGRKVA